MNQPNLTTNELLLIYSLIQLQVIVAKDKKIEIPEIVLTLQEKFRIWLGKEN